MTKKMKKIFKQNEETEDETSLFLQNYSPKWSSYPNFVLCM
jgi:hypothetical protein